MNFTHAIIKLPAINFADGITTSTLGEPDISLALEQHEQYCLALQSCGLKIFKLDADPLFPDSTFIEDTAILTSNFYVLTKPGAPSRQGEAKIIEPVLVQFYKDAFRIEAPGTLDGGDVCQAEDVFFIGISNRTNKEGAQQLKTILEANDFEAFFIDIRRSTELLHLKSGLAYIGSNTLVLTRELSRHTAFSAYKHIIVDEKENYGANCIRINEFVLIAQGYPILEKSLVNSGFKIKSLPMSEFQKMDGGLSCLSLRF